VARISLHPLPESQKELDPELNGNIGCDCQNHIFVEKRPSGSSLTAPPRLLNGRLAMLLTGVMVMERVCIQSAIRNIKLVACPSVAIAIKVEAPTAGTMALVAI